MKKTVVFATLMVFLCSFVCVSCICHKSNGSDSPSPPSIQVTNNSGSLIHKVKVGDIEFSENLDMCGSGCSTGFKDVKEGENQISVQLSEGSAWETIGTLAGFKNGNHYAVNITGARCAELWILHQTDIYFNDDTTKELIGSVCPGGA